MRIPPARTTGRPKITIIDDDPDFELSLSQDEVAEGAVLTINEDDDTTTNTTLTIVDNDGSGDQ